MELITISEIKEQCYLDEFDLSEDNYLKILSSAAIKHIENYTNRKVFASENEVPEGVENALIWSDDIKIAALLLIGHLYENRENSSEKKMNEIPFGFHAFVSPYKYIPM